MRASVLSFQAVIFVVAGMIWGLVMAISADHITLPAHARLYLLGWVPLFLFGIYIAYMHRWKAPEALSCRSMVDYRNHHSLDWRGSGAHGTRRRRSGCGGRIDYRPSRYACVRLVGISGRAYENEYSTGDLAREIAPRVVSTPERLFPFAHADV